MTKLVSNKHVLRRMNIDVSIFEGHDEATNSEVFVAPTGLQRIDSERIALLGGCLLSPLNDVLLLASQLNVDKMRAPLLRHVDDVNDQILGVREISEHIENEVLP